MYILASLGSQCFKMPCQLVNLTSSIIDALKIIAVILIVVFGMLDFLKATVAKNEADIDKGKKLFIKRLISFAFLFLVIYVVQFAGNVLDVNKDKDVMSCVSYLIKGDSSQLYCTH